MLSQRASQMPQLAFAGGQATTNFAQRLRPPKVAEQHGHERPTSEPASIRLGPVLGNGLFNLLPVKQPQHLAENAGYSYYGGDGPQFYGLRLATQTVAEFYPRCSKPISDNNV